jgi:hypothetical protein
MKKDGGTHNSRHELKKKINVFFPRIPLHSNVMSVFGTNGPIVEVKGIVLRFPTLPLPLPLLP